jgi:asparagine synthase (glutamine-hydrolysing)
MCGLAGILNYQYKSSVVECSNIASIMANKIQHRGPDDFGTWGSKDGLITLTHQRLSIQDLSDAGHQPMVSKSKNLVLEFNGEIYNHQELRALFDSSYSWRGNSDTETLVALIEKFGIDKALSCINGMFVIVFWDILNQKLTLVRDRFGEKPLYYFDNKNHFVFASELKALMETPWVSKDIDFDSMSNYFQHSFVKGSNSIFKNIKKLLPGEKISITFKNRKIKKENAFYWSSKDNIEISKNNVFLGSLDDAANEVEKMLRSTIKKQLIADVPVGIFLSGGVDSSLITLIAQQESLNKLKTFNIGFDSKEYDESGQAGSLAKELGVEHSSIFFNAHDALSMVSKLPSIYDEPFADAAQMPTLMLSKIAKEKVSVVLSGDGGDELFGGYTRYISGPKILEIISQLPLSVRVLAEKILSNIPPNYIDNLMKIIIPFLGKNRNFYQLSRKLSSLARLLSASNEEDLYNRMRFFWHRNLPINNSLKPLAEIRAYKMMELNNSCFSENMMASDTNCYLPDNICVKFDRAAMSNSLEGRLPFLDHNLFNFAWSLPLSYKINNGEGKIVLRKILKNNSLKMNIPQSKQGFSLPIGSWLKNEMKEWANDLLSYDNLRKYDFLDTNLINDRWQKHLKGGKNYENDIWLLLVFLEWVHQNKVTI